MDREIVRGKIRNAIRTFNREKSHLYSVNIYEPTISHRIALYLENEFKDYSVDCEYNKNLGESKMSDDDIKIRPDIIIHKRNSAGDNLVIIEIKKAGKNSKKAQADIQKLQNTDNLHYSNRVFLGILKDRTDIVWVDDRGVEGEEEIQG